MSRSPGVLFLLGLLAGALPAQSPVLTLRSPVVTDGVSSFGRPFAVLGDLDGDGIREILAGSPYESQHGAVYLFSGRDGRPLFRASGDGFGEFFGGSVANAGDVDADGIPDFLVGAPGDGPIDENFGSVFLYSGRNHRRLLQLKGKVARGSFGAVVEGAGDVNGDGHSDFLVSSPGESTGGCEAGAVRVFSGADGSVLYTFFGTGPGVTLGYLGRAGDVNGDGIPDFLMSEARGFVARVYSGRDGSLLLHLVNPLPEITDFYFIEVAGLGDLDQDGCDDVALGSEEARVGGVRTGVVLVFSGRTGNLLYDLTGDGFDDAFSFPAAMPDLDGDGVPDFAVGAPTVSSSRIGYLRAFSGRDASPLFTLRASSSITGFGLSMRAFDDLDGDGVPEFLVSAQDAPAGDGRSGKITAFSSRTRVEVQAPVPGRAGALNAIVASAEGAGRPLVLYWGPYRGFTHLSGCPRGFALDLHDPKIAGMGTTDIFGKVLFRFFVPPRFRHQNTWIQAVEASTCLQSKVRRVFFR